MKLSIETLNVLIMGIAFMFLFTAYSTSQNFAVTLLGNNGYYVLSVLYFFASFSNFVASAFIQKINSTKISMMVAGLCYTQYLGAIALFLLLVSKIEYVIYFVYCSSAILGIGAGVLWTAQGAALVANSNTTTRGKLSGLFFGFFQTSFVAGNFCAFLAFYFNIQSFVLFLGFVAISALGSFLFLLMRESKPQQQNTITSKSEESIPEKHNKTIKEMIETFKLLKSHEIVPSIPLFLCSSITQSYTSGAFTLLFNEDKSRVGAIFTVFGISAIVSSLVCGLLKDRLSQRSFFFVTVLTNFIRVIGAIVVELLIGEMHATSSLILFSFIFFIEAAYFALGDALVNIYIYTLLGALFPKSPLSERSVAIFKFVQSFGSAVAFFYARYTSGLIQLTIIFVLWLIAFTLGLWCGVFPTEKTRSLIGKETNTTSETNNNLIINTTREESMPILQQTQTDPNSFESSK